jgi:hypothetical protein
VELQRELAVGLLDVLDRGAAGDPEDLVPVRRRDHGEWFRVRDMFERRYVVWAV